MEDRFSNDYNVVASRVQACADLKGTSIFLEGKGLTSLPSSLRSVPPSLRDLYLYSNEIRSLNSKTLRCLSGVRNLSLFNNQITIIPPAIGFLTSLRELQLESNQISALPAQIGI